MKKLFTTLLAVAAMSPALMAESVSLPYMSDMFTDVSQMDEGWTKANSGNRRALVWEYDRDNTGSALATPGTKSAACHNYDPDYDANCWMFSPEVTLKAGGNYTIGVWAKSKGTDSENFKICYGAEASAAAMTSTLLDCPDFVNPDDYVFKTATLVPTENMTVHFGINCYTPSNHYVLSLTGFTVSDENGNLKAPEQPEQPGDAQAIPFTYSFTSEADFDKDWTSGYGEDSGVQAKWQFVNALGGYVKLDYTPKDGKENNWLISQPLNFAEAGSYALKYKGLINGKIEFMLGDGTENLEGYTVIDTKEDSSFDNDVEYTVNFNVATPGEYRVAIHSCAEAHTFMGYRLFSLKVLSDKPVPALVTDLTATPSALDELEVALAWTNPAVDHAGNPLSAITKIELFRNGTMVKDDFASLAPGAANAWMDRPEEAGVYTYHLLVYNENGLTDAEPVKVLAGFVGRPTATLPYSVDSSEPDDMAPFTYVDGNGDGVTWQFVEGSSKFWNEVSVKLPDGGEFDDYLISPYLHLTPGYYVFDYTVSCRFNSYEAGYVTDRHNPAGTFVKLNEIIDWQEYGSPTGHTVFAIDEEGDYALCIHAIGAVTNSSYYTISMSDMSLEATTPLPAGIAELTASDAPAEEGYDVTLTWTNPAVDNAGKPLGEDAGLTITVKRGEDTVATLSGADYAAGMECSYTDKGVAEGEYTYFVHVGNANGFSEDLPAQTTVYAGPLLAIPYSTENFSDWKIDDSSYYCWTVDATTGQAKWEAFYGWNKYSIFTPHLSLDPDKQYEIEATLAGDAYQGVGFVSSTRVSDQDATMHHSFTLPEADTDHIFSAIVTAADNAPEPLADDDTESDEAKPTEITVPTGKVLLGFCNNGGGRIILKAFSIKEHIPTGIDAVETEAADAPAEYYNLQGIRVTNPRAGIYILRQGNKSTKVML